MSVRFDLKDQLDNPNINNDNDIDDLTSDQVKAIFTGETTEWEDLAK